MRIFLVLLLNTFTIAIPTKAFGIGYPSFHSEIPGASIWNPQLQNGDKFPNEGTEQNDYEFINHCNGKNTIYVHELRKRFPCKATELYKGEGWSNYRIDILDNNKGLLNKITVSKKGPATSSFTISKPGTGDLEKTAAVLSTRKKILKSISEKNIYNYLQTKSEKEVRDEYNRSLKEAKKSELYNKAINDSRLIKTTTSEFLILPIGIEIDGLGWNIKSAVFIKKVANLDFIGEISGCIDNALELNQDNTPEIGTYYCENSEGSHDSYWSIYPSVKEVLYRSQ